MKTDKIICEKQLKGYLGHSTHSIGVHSSLIIFIISATQEKLGTYTENLAQNSLTKWNK